MRTDTFCNADTVEGGQRSYLCLHGDLARHSINNEESVCNACAA